MDPTEPAVGVIRDNNSFVGFTIILKDIVEVYKAVSDFRYEGNPTLKYKVYKNQLDLKSVEFGNPGYNRNPMKVCFYKPECSTSWCIAVANISDGASSFIWKLSRNLQFTYIKVRSRSYPKDNWIEEMTVARSGEIVRCVRAMWDDRNDFYAVGEPYFFEDISRYGARRIRDRFTRSDIIDFLAKLGLPILRPEFWTTTEDAFYYEEEY